MKTLQKLILATAFISFSDIPTNASADYPSQSTSTQKTQKKTHFKKLYEQLGSDSFMERREATNTLKKRVNEIDIENICRLYGSDSLEVRKRAENIAIHLIKNKKDFDISRLVQLYDHEDIKISSNAKKLFRDSIDCPEKYPQIDCLPNYLYGTKDNKYKDLEKRFYVYLKKASSLNIYQKDSIWPHYSNFRIATHLLIRDLKESDKYSSQEIKEILKLGWQAEKKWRIRDLGDKQQREIEEYAPIPSTLLKK